jgi:hypothetical protein
MAGTAGPDGTDDRQARLLTALRTVAGVVTVADLPELLRGARAGRDVAALRRDAEQITELARTLTQFAARLAAAGQEVARVGGRRLPDAIVGTTGATAGVCIHALKTGLAGADVVMQVGGSALSTLAWTREGVERGDIADADELALLVDQIARVVTEYGRDPGATWLPARVSELRDAAHAAIFRRIRSHATLLAVADTAARSLYDLVGLARLAKLGASPMPAVDKMVIAEAGADAAHWDPIITAATAERAAQRLSTLTPEQAAQLDRVLGQAQSPVERAYILKALAAGYDVNQVTDFAAKIHPYGNNPQWLDEHLAPLDTAIPVGDGGDEQDTTFGTELWYQKKTPECGAFAVLTARAQVDPVYALQLTAGGQPGSQLDTPALFAERLRVEGARVYYDARGLIGLVTPEPGVYLEDPANSELGPLLGVHYERQDVDVPLDPDLVTQVARVASTGTPVPLEINERTGEAPHAVTVINHYSGRFLLYDPALGATFWVTDDQLSQGTLTRVEPSTHPVTTGVIMPINQ